MYNKLFAKILDSSIWLEPTPTRIVWVMMLAAMDEEGFAQFASVANVAHRARVTLEEAEQALADLEGPDPNSSDPDREGRRLERVPGGWMVLNAEKYRDLVTRDAIRAKTRERVRKHRALKRTCNADVTESDTDTDTDVHTHLGAAPVKPLTKPLAYKRRIDVAWPGRPPVPSILHAEFIEKLGGDPEEARRRLDAWYPLAAAPYDGQDIGDDDFRFWRLRFREWVGTTAKPPGASPTKTPAEVEAETAAALAMIDGWKAQRQVRR